MANSMQDLIEKFDSIYRDNTKAKETFSLWDVLILCFVSYTHFSDNDTCRLDEELINLFREYPSTQFEEGVQAIFELLDHPAGKDYDLLLLDILVNLRVAAVIPKLENMMRNPELTYDRYAAAQRLIHFEHKEAQEFIVKYVSDPSREESLWKRTFRAACSLNDISTPFTVVFGRRLH